MEKEESKSEGSAQLVNIGLRHQWSSQIVTQRCMEGAGDWTSFVSTLQVPHRDSLQSRPTFDFFASNRSQTCLLLSA